MTWIAPEEVARFTGDTGRDVEAGRALEIAREEDGRAINGLERSATEGLDSTRFVGFDLDARETEFRPETTEGVSGVCASDRPRRWLGVFGLRAIAKVRRTG